MTCAWHLSNCSIWLIFDSNWFEIFFFLKQQVLSIVYVDLGNSSSPPASVLWYLHHTKAPPAATCCYSCLKLKAFVFMNKISRITDFIFFTYHYTHLHIIKAGFLNKLKFLLPNLSQNMLSLVYRIFICFWNVVEC